MNALANIQLRLPFIIEKEGDIFVASCPVLDVFSQGFSHEEALKNLNEALVLFVETCFDMGTLDEVLKSCGFKSDGQDDELDIKNMLDVLVPLIAQNASSHAC